MEVAHPQLPLSDAPPGRKTDNSTWTDLTTDDEVAVLLSLVLGARVRSGGLTRMFTEDGDPRGNAVEWGHRPPTWSPPGRNGPVLPGLSDAVANLGDLSDWLSRYGRLNKGEAATSLLRAARQYRDGLWIADTDPQLAWLLFVSALEVAACHHRVAGTDLAAVLTEAKPKLAQDLREAGGKDLLDKVAGHLAEQLRATRRFLDFTTTFAPSPPERQPEHTQINWGKLRRAMNVVYGFRSDRLHAGIPFPAPMCMPPITDDNGVPLERPPGLWSAVSSPSSWSSWRSTDLPMYLHTFADITRRTLLAWWKHMTEPSRS
jgi:hypothetical protein